MHRRCWNSGLPVLMNAPGDTIRCWVCKQQVKVTDSYTVAAHTRKVD